MPIFETDDKRDDNEKRDEWVRSIRKQGGSGSAQKALNDKVMRKQWEAMYKQSEFDGGDCPNG